jgi:hypothetical protein
MSGYPDNLSWGNIDTNNDGVRENYLTPIKGQHCSDCFVYTAVGMLEIQYKIDHRSEAPLDLSEQNIHNCMRISCKASGDFRPILNYMRNYGILEEKYVKAKQWGTCDNCSSSVSSEEGIVPTQYVPFFHASDWRHVTVPGMSYADKVKSIVAALQVGPVGAHVNGWNGFKIIGDTRYCTGFKTGGHAMIIVGYLDKGRIFIVKNSHGESSVIKMASANGDKCLFANISGQIIPGSTHMEHGSGVDYCFSMVDRDGDSVPDVDDNCPWNENADQKDVDGDTYGDACDKYPQEKGAPGQGSTGRAR